MSWFITILEGEDPKTAKPIMVINDQEIAVALAKILYTRFSGASDDEITPVVNIEGIGS